MNNNFKEKYLKYKIKYLTIQKGGKHKVTIKYSNHKKGYLNTDIGNILFYDNFDKTENEKFALLNGANNNFASGQGGTNRAITDLSTLFKFNFFDEGKINILFNSSDFNQVKNLESFINGNQMIPFKGKSYLAGSVFKSKCDVLKSRVSTVYHIKGVSVYGNKETENTIKPLTMEYYKQILIDFNNLGNEQFIYMPPIPGMTY